MRIHALMAVVLLSACTTTEYVFTPPATAEGKACVERCQASQATCRRDQDARAERIRAQCQDEADRRETACRIQAPIEYAACLKFAKGDAERAACQLQDCTQAACQASSNYALCDNDFRFCYQNCGGTIDLIER